MVDNKVVDLTPEEKEYAQYLEERKMLIDAARESARTFDKAVLTVRQFSDFPSHL
jgi:hypothetical protein